MVPATWTTEIAFLAKQGYSQMVVNFRGSTGFGRERIRLLPGKIGEMDIFDCYQAARFCLDKRNCDPERSFVTGGSHGGFITCHLVAAFPDLFQAAVTRNPATNLAAMTAISDIPDWVLYQVNGEEWAQRQPASKTEISKLSHLGNVTATFLAKAYEKSPISKVREVKTPILFQLGKNDVRVPPSQGLSFHKAIQGQGGVSEVSWYGNDNHPLGTVDSMADVSLNLYRWFESQGRV